MPNKPNLRQRLGNYVKRVVTLEEFKDNFFDSSSFFNHLAHGGNEAFNILVKGETAPIYGGHSFSPNQLVDTPEPTEQQTLDHHQSIDTIQPVYAAAEPVNQPGYAMTQAAEHPAVTLQSVYSTAVDDITSPGHFSVADLVTQAEQHIEQQTTIDPPQMEPDMD